MLHKLLARRGDISATGSTFARFAYAMPAAADWLVTAAVPGPEHAGHGLPVPGAGLSGPGRWSGGMGQILATVLVVLAFRERNFAVGITFKKTEVIQTALMGLVRAWASAISPLGWLGRNRDRAGGRADAVEDARHAPRGCWQRLGQSRAVLLGVGSGFFFAVAGVGYRATTLEVPSEDPVLRGGTVAGLRDGAADAGHGVLAAAGANRGSLRAVWARAAHGRSGWG